MFTTLDKHLASREFDALSDDEAQRWVAALVTKKRSAFTVMTIWVTALKAVGRWAVKQRYIARNPFAVFYKPAATDATDMDSTNPKRSPPVALRGRLATWIRSIGITDKEVSPTHGWRPHIQADCRPPVRCDHGPCAAHRRQSLWCPDAGGHGERAEAVSAIQGRTPERKRR